MSIIIVKIVVIIIIIIIVIVIMITIAVQEPAAGLVALVPPVLPGSAVAVAVPVVPCGRILCVFIYIYIYICDYIIIYLVIYTHI